jgi:hypothetical protein
MEFNGSKVPQEEGSSGVFKDFDVPTARVPFELLRDFEVRDKAVRLYGIYFEEADNWRGYEPKRVKRIRQREWADRLGCKPETVSILTTELHDRGWLSRKRTGRSNIIILHGRRKRRKPKES